MAATQTDAEKGVEPLVPGLVVRPETTHYIHILGKPISCFTLHILGQSVAVFRIRIQPVSESGSTRFFMTKIKKNIQFEIFRGSKPIIYVLLNP
jgi:hypothetical protein